MDNNNFKIDVADGYIELTHDLLTIQGPQLVEKAVKGHLYAAVRPRLKKLFEAGNNYVLLCVGQYWNDEASDAVHHRLIASFEKPDLTWFSLTPEERWERYCSVHGGPDVDKLSEWEKEELELSGTLSISEEEVFPGNGLSWDDLYADHDEKMSLYRYWDNNGWAIELYSMFAPLDGDQEKDTWDSYAPAVLFTPDSMEVLEPCRGWGQPSIHLTRRYRPDAPEVPVIGDVLSGLAVNALLGK